MNKDEYRAAFDRVKLREGFRQDAVETLMRAAGQRDKKEIMMMKPRRTMKTALLAAALAAALVVSAAAAVILLRPQDVATHVNDPVLATAFESAGAVQINESARSGDYAFTLGGLVSGAGISKYTLDVDASRTYVVVSVARIDGAPLEDLPSTIQFSPLVSGYQPSQVNAWTLGGGYTAFMHEGTAYYLFEYKRLEMFADHKVYLVGGENLSLFNGDYVTAEDGSISLSGSIANSHVLFSLPMDASKADPAAVEQFLAEQGITP